MRVTSASDFRRNLAKHLDSVADDHTPLLITRDRGKPPAVLMSLEDFASYEETRYLLSSEANRRALLEAIEDVGAGRVVSVDWPQDPSDAADVDAANGP